LHPGEERTPAVPIVLWRGVRLRCPACGQGRLFHAYLKLNRACPRCSADFSRAETADVAPYVTVFIVGVLVMPSTAILAFDRRVNADFVLLLSLLFAVALTLVLLPRVKGTLAALLWRAQREM